MDDLQHSTASMIAARDLDEPECMELLVPLRQWTEAERKLDKDKHDADNAKASIIRKITLAYAICKSIHHISQSVKIESVDALVDVCSIDNFVVRVSEDESEPGWKVKGLETVSPPLILKLNTAEVLDDDFFNKATISSGKHVRASMTIHSSKCWPFKAVPAAIDKTKEKRLLGLTGKLLRDVFVGIEREARQTKDTLLAREHMGQQRPNKKKSHPTEKSPAKLSQAERSDSVSSSRSEPIELLVSTEEIENSLSVALINALIDADLGVFSSDNAYQSFDDAISDLVFVLKEPEHFLFDHHEGRAMNLNSGKLYGRSREKQILKNVFSRVHTSGKSEACFISGYSGSGKTCLVNRCYEYVDAANGCIVMKKFEDTLDTSGQSPLTLTLSAFNDLCLEVNAKLTPDDARSLYNKFVEEFGESLKMLSRVLPNILCFESTSSEQVESDLDNEVNYHSLCFIVQQFMTVISTTSIPFLIVFDDMQWADPISVGLIHSVLSNQHSCVMFVGCYRDNEVANNHIVLGLIKMLSKFDVSTTRVHLAGLKPKDLNHMISDALGMLPRFCRKLSDIICKKTDGNPFFSIALLRSLDGSVVQYSLRERRWTYDIDAVHAEDISPNVVHLILSKMTSLSQDCQTALIVASSFGIQVDLRIIKVLSTSQQYCMLESSMFTLVEKGFVAFAGSKFRFEHDRIREAAYGLLHDDRRDKFHFRIGVLLHYSISLADMEIEPDLLFIVTQQINHGVPTLISESQKGSVAELNCSAGRKRLMECNFLPSYSYMKLAASLLSSDSWISHYELSLNCHFYLAKAAYPCGYVDVARESLDIIIKCAKSLEDKMNAYTLLVLIQATNNPPEALTLAIQVLSYLGENVDEDKDDAKSMNLYMQVKRKFMAIGDMFALPEDENQGKEREVMYFYSMIGTLAFRLKPECILPYISRYAAYAFDNRVKCKHTPNAIVSFASIMCSSLGPDTQQACKIGRIGMSLLKMYYPSSDAAPETILAYYGQIGLLNENIQECEFMHARGREVALQTGNIHYASLNLIAQISRALQGGTNLAVLKQDIQVHLKKAENVEKDIAVQLEKTGNASIEIPGLKIFLQLTDVLIDGESSSCQPKVIGTATFLKDILYQGQLMYSIFFGEIDQAFHIAKKIQTRSLFGNLLRDFYLGLASIDKYRNTKSEELLDDVKSTLSKLAYANQCSEWNFANKLALLQAELSSVEGNDTVQHYASAIKSAHSSKFIHEEALAYELAGRHRKRNDDIAEALDLLKSAEICYTQWGSTAKAKQMKNEIESLSQH